MTFEDLQAQLRKDIDDGIISEDDAKKRLLEFYVAEMNNAAAPTTLTEGASTATAPVDFGPPIEPVFAGDVRGVNSADLQRSTNPEAIAELESRSRIENEGFVQNLQNPEFFRRLLSSAGKAPAQTINAVTEALPAMLLMGAEKVTGSGAAGDAAMNMLSDFEENNEGINQTFKSSDPINAAESIGESVMGALVPGGIVAKGVGMAGDYTLDQTVREMTDDAATPYKTVFDELGITNDQEKPWMKPAAAIGATITIGMFAPGAVKALSRNRLPKPVQRRPIQELNANGPEGVDTIENTNDLIIAYTTDQQEAAKRIARRAGVPDIEDIESRIDLDTHSASRTRVNEALQTGRLSNKNATFATRVPPQLLHDAYKQLDPVMQKDVADYIHLKDMRDDVLIAIQNSAPGQNATRLQMLSRQISALEAKTPIVKQFSDDYNNITKSVREYLSGGLFTGQRKQQLDRERPNYVPLKTEQIDRDAPLLNRINQAQEEGSQQLKDDWFLQTRTNAGTVDPSKRVDPFDLLMDYTNAALTKRLKNDTTLAYIDGLLNSADGRTTIRLKTKDDKDVDDWTVKVMRNGEEETYVTSRLTADLLKFDPFIAKWPVLYAPKRLQELAMVGPLSITFAPVTAIRDTIGGAVMRPDGVVSATAMDTIKAVPEQLWAKGAKAVSETMQARLKANGQVFPEALMPIPQQQALADKIGSHYMNSLYHQMNAKGGFDASLMKEQIRVGEGIFKELSRSISEGVRNSALSNAATRGSSEVVKKFADGFIAIFNSMQDAPRYATVKNTAKQSGDIESAVIRGRSITGDVTRSGRVYDPAGKRINADLVDEGLYSAGVRAGAGTFNAIREGTPFINPMIQGTRRLVNSYAEAPTEFMMRAWTNVGIPALVAHGWNNLQGEEYNQYAMEGRSARDVAMNMYIALPGRPPEEGLEVPLPHELLFFNSPFTQVLDSMARGNPEAQESMSVLVDEILSNSLDVGFPTVGQLGLNAFNRNAPDSLIRDGGEAMYSIREDGLGFLPQNIETMIRTQFGLLGDTAVQTAYAVAEEPGNFESYYDSLLKNVEKRSVVKGPRGAKVQNNWFSIPNEVRTQKMDAFNQFKDLYDQFLNPKRQAEDGFIKPSSRKGYTDDKGILEEDLPFRMVGPDPVVAPTNPLYEMVGPAIRSAIATNEQGMSGLEDRSSQYNKYTRRLKRFNSTDQEELKAWQEKLDNTENLTAESEKMKEMLDGLEIDLTNYYDRIKLINAIENERGTIIRSQLDLIEKVETDITMVLREEGLLSQDQWFDMEKHLKPFDVDPLGGSPNSNGPL